MTNQIQKDTKAIIEMFLDYAKKHPHFPICSMSISRIAERSEISTRRKNYMNYTRNLLNKLVEEGYLTVDYNEVHQLDEYSITHFELGVQRHFKNLK